VTLNQSKSSKNKFCKLTTLKNESDVEQFFVIRLLKDLDYTDSQIRTKEKLDEIVVARGSNKENYRPDYVLLVNGKPRVVIDAKNPKEKIRKFLYQVTGYALGLNQRYEGENPVLYCMLTNGGSTELYKWDSIKAPLIPTLVHGDFHDGNPKFENLRVKLNSNVWKSISSPVSEDKIITLIKPPIEEIKVVFQKCHDLIFKRESLLPTEAFYEFTKLIFLKMNEDKYLHKILDAGKSLRLKDLHFHTYWIDSNLTVTPNPMNAVLFQKLVSDLEDLVEKKAKKPIFDEGEKIKLKPSTIKDVVKLLQDYDLYGIDTDLNGRMFEVFLAAVIRGKKLGAYFTPRAIVELIVKMADIRIITSEGKSEIETTLDGCCGSGGFLIDAMAGLINKIKTNPILSPNADELVNKLVTKHLYGIDSNPEIARIARINMYLHGDGGSNIYRANTLDKEIQVELGEDKTTRNELEELRKLLFEEGKKFDVIITNPPFATSYKSKDAYEKRIIFQYADLDTIKNLSYKEGTTELKSEIKSNILFIARYHDLLKAGGRLVIVVDNSLLNSVRFAEYRVWLKNNFIIRAVIALPKYSFIQAGAGGVTSILFLEKRNEGTLQKQPPIFARKVHYTGLSKAGKEIKENDLPYVQEEWKRFVATGKLYLKGEKLIGNYDSDTLFLIEDVQDRLDVDFYAQSYRLLLKKLAKLKADGAIENNKMIDFDISPNIKKEDAQGKVFRYADIGAIDYDRCEFIRKECLEEAFEELPNRARVLLNENDVIFPLSYDSLGKCAIVPNWMDGQLASTGFMGIRCKNHEEAIFLWALIRSETMQKQFLHTSSGYTQRGISKEHLNAYVLFPIPKDGKVKDAIVNKVKGKLKSASKARQDELDAYNGITSIMKNSLLSS